MVTVPEGYVRRLLIVSGPDWYEDAFREQLLQDLRRDPDRVFDERSMVTHDQIGEVHVPMWVHPDLAHDVFADCPTCGVSPLNLEGGETRIQQAGVGMGQKITTQIVCSECGTPPTVRGLSPQRHTA